MAKCIICGGQGEKTRFWHTKPDKYEELMGLGDIKRLWVKCKKCGFYWQIRNYPLSKLEKIYESGYRSKKFRGESIEHAYNRIRKLPYSENERRFYWFATHARYKDTKEVLDIGSGIGVWPKVLKDAEYKVECVEANRASVDFICSEVGVTCYYDLDHVDNKYDCITVIHVLEHIKNINGFLSKISDRLKPNGYLFIEVPDNIAFKHLGKHHDDFNSCHQWSFDMASLATLLKRNGFNPIHASQVVYESRGLSRLYMLCN